jgi:drug/metabolite transporter (DMT)-like permease
LKRTKAELILFFIATLWALTFIVIKLTIDETPPFLFVCLRFSIATLLFIIIFFNKIKIHSKAELFAGIILGVFLFLGFASQTIGMKYTTASNSALITGISVLLVPFAQIVIEKKPVTLNNWISVTIASIGLFMLTKPFETGFNIGDLITIICAISWAFYIVYLDIWTRKYDLYSLVFIQFIVVSLLSLIPYLIFESVNSINFNKEFVTAILYTSIFATLISTFLGNKYQKETTPVRAGIIFLWEQPAAVMLAVIFLGEALDIIQITGGVLMVAGIGYSAVKN